MVTGTKMQTLAVAEITRDMLDTLVMGFDMYSRSGVIAVEITDDGLWVMNPETGRRDFLGVRELPSFIASGQG